MEGGIAPGPSRTGPGALSQILCTIVRIREVAGRQVFQRVARLSSLGGLRASEKGRGHAQCHQSLALGIGADALGELYWLPD